MSKKQKIINVSELSEYKSLPVAEPKRKQQTGNGSATFKTATAAAKAAIEARDEARAIRKDMAGIAVEAHQMLKRGKEQDAQLKNTIRASVWFMYGLLLANVLVSAVNAIFF